MTFLIILITVELSGLFSIILNHNEFDIFRICILHIGSPMLDDKISLLYGVFEFHVVFYSLQQNCRCSALHVLHKAITVNDTK